MSRSKAQKGRPALKGMAEAERQVRVARKLYELTKPTKPWEKLRLEERRPFIDLSCQPPHVDDGYE